MIGNRLFQKIKKKSGLHLWYKEIWEDNKGKTDSSDIIWMILELKMVKLSGWMNIPGNCIKSTFCEFF